MPRLQPFLAALALLPSISLAVAPASVPPNGKGHGFIGDLDNNHPPPNGDWLTSTLCYCRSTTPAKEMYEYDRAHIFQHEYYNYHSNATFILDHVCLSEDAQCVEPNIGGDNIGWFREDPFVCKTFPRTEEEQILQANSKRSTGPKKEEKRKWPGWLWKPHGCILDCEPGPFDHSPPKPADHQDKVCFAVNNNYYGTTKMELMFNGQHRKMHKGEQGRIQTDAEEVHGYCEDVCQSEWGWPADMKIDDKQAGGGSRQFVYTSLDDMCDHCA